MNSKGNTMHTAKQVIERVLNDVYLHISVASKYSEPGYSKAGDGPILLGNWNERTRYENGKVVVVDRTMARIAEIAERAGCTLEWYDEWTICSECGGAVRTQADSFLWVPSWFERDGESICHECFNPEADLEQSE